MLAAATQLGGGFLARSAVTSVLAPALCSALRSYSTLGHAIKFEAFGVPEKVGAALRQPACACAGGGGLPPWAPADPSPLSLSPQVLSLSTEQLPPASQLGEHEVLIKMLAVRGGEGRRSVEALSCGPTDCRLAARACILCVVQMSR